MNPTEMYTGWSGTAASSSVRVGSRTSLNWLGLNPPIVVMKLSALTGGLGDLGSVAALAQVDDLRAGRELLLGDAEAVAHVDHEVAPDRDHAGHGAGAVHRVDPAVGQDQVSVRRRPAAVA
ncbi:MAG: hypothetical protein ACRDNO_26450 [Trebonia sp.]